MAGYRATVLHNQKFVSTQLARLSRPAVVPGSRPGVAEGGTLNGVPLLPEIPAGDMEDGVYVELTVVFPYIGKCDVLDVAYEPGRLMIE
jgi:hypothetical protein